MWDIKIVVAGEPKKGYPNFTVHFPAALSRALQNKGYDRAVLELTEDGILVRPYVSNGTQAKRRPLPIVEIPEWK